MKRIIALLTDFGLDDPYVGQMKAVLAAGAPDTRIVDVTHNVRPFNILQAAFFLAASWKHFPRGTVFVCVVDPGVGSERRIVLVERDGRYAFAPDNGLLSSFLSPPDGVRAWDVTPEKEPGSRTFHGRDIFAPLAAWLAREESPDLLGSKIQAASLHRLESFEPVLSPYAIVTHVLHTDHFGNCVLNLEIPRWRETLESWGTVEITHPTCCRAQTAPNYSSVPKGVVGIVAGSQGYFELALDRNSAARLLNLKIGDMVRIKKITSCR